MTVQHPAPAPTTLGDGASAAPSRGLRRRSIGRRAVLALAVMASAVVPATASAATDPHPVTPVAHVDVSKYLGSWYQIAALPQWYETLCQKNVTANYALNTDGTVKVTNTCSGPVGTKIQTVGRAKVDDTTSNASLEVSFVNIFNWWFFTGKPNYDIVGLGDNYDYAVVGDPARQSAFVLSRTPTLTLAQHNAAIDALMISGFNPCALANTPQTGGSSSTDPFCTPLPQ